MYTSAASQISLICPGERYGSGLWNDDVACCDCAISASPLCVEMVEHEVPREVRTLGTAPTQQNSKSKTKSVSTKCLPVCQNETPVSGAANPIPELALCNLCFFHLVNS